ncbi:MAG: protein kinase [Planctomycetes bacterium]|nr:protein kinase [Planctomycetota bacterium]
MGDAKDTRFLSLLQARGWMDRRAVEECRAVQRQVEALGLRQAFADIAVQKGYLSASQAGTLLAALGEGGHQKIQGYEILEKLGEGAMGAVYKARQTFMQRTVAIKVLHPGHAAAPQARERFLREARLLASLNHPNIVQALDAGESAGTLFVVMEYVPSESLRARLQREGGLEPDAALRIVAQVAAALDHAHRHKLVHRDVKPENILVGADGGVKLADLGLSKSIGEEDGGLTRSGTSMGTPQYMSPEQIEDARSVDIRSDLYALGVVLYEMVAGTNPCRCDNVAGTIARHVMGDWEPLAARMPGLPAGLLAVHGRMMRCSRDERYPTPRALLDDLARLEEGRPLAGQECAAAPTGPARPAVAPPEGGVGGRPKDTSRTHSPPATRSTRRGTARVPTAAAAQHAAARAESVTGVSARRVVGRRPALALLLAAPFLGVALWWLAARPPSQDAGASKAGAPPSTVAGGGTPSRDTSRPGGPAPRADALAAVQALAKDPAREEEALRLLDALLAQDLPPQEAAAMRAEHEELTARVLARVYERRSELHRDVETFLQAGTPRAALERVDGASHEFTAMEWLRACAEMREGIRSSTATRVSALVAAVRAAAGRPPAERSSALEALRAFLEAARGVFEPDAETRLLLEEAPAEPAASTSSPPGPATTPTPPAAPATAGAAAQIAQPPLDRFVRLVSEHLLVRRYADFVREADLLLAGPVGPADAALIRVTRDAAAKAPDLLARAANMVREQAFRSPLFRDGRRLEVVAAKGVPHFREAGALVPVDAAALSAPELARLWEDHGDAPSDELKLLASLDSSFDFTEWLDDAWCAFAVDTSKKTSVTWDEEERRCGRRSVRLVTDSDTATVLVCPATRNADWDLSGSEFLRVQLRAAQPRGAGRQGAVPTVALRSRQGGYVLLTPDRDLLLHDGSWAELACPLRGGAGWTRQEIVPLAGGRVDWFEFLFDPSGDGFEVWVDGCRFDPAPPSVLLSSAYRPDLSLREVRMEPAFPRYDVAWVGGVPKLQGAANPARAPVTGAPVRFTATVANVGPVDSAATTWRWSFPEGKVLAQDRLPALAPGASATFSVTLRWPAKPHESRFRVEVDPENRLRELGKSNNTVLSRLSALSVRLYLKHRALEKVPVTRSVFGSPDLVDHVRGQLGLLDAIVSGVAGTGALADFPRGLRLDRVSEWEAGGRPPPDAEADVVLYVDRTLAESLYASPGYPSRAIQRALLTDTERSLGLGLVPLAWLNVEGKANEVNGAAYDATAGRADLVGGLDALSAMPWGWLSPFHVQVLAARAQSRSGYRGEYLFALPERVTLVPQDAAGHPLEGATLTFFQAARGRIDATPEFTAKADKAGLVRLPLREAPAFRTETGVPFGPNPFGKLSLEEGNGLFLARVTHGRSTKDVFLDVTALNVAWLSGSRKTASLPLATGMECPHK